MSEPLLSQLTIECALSALRVIHDSLNEPSAHFSVEVQRAHQVEILVAIRELTHLQSEGTPQPPQPGVMEQDWFLAPDWATYRTRDVSGVTMWWETKPFYDGRIGAWMNEDESLRARGSDLPLLRQRPQEPDTKQPG